MVTVVPGKKSFGTRFGEALGPALKSGYENERGRIHEKELLQQKLGQDEKQKQADIQADKQTAEVWGKYFGPEVQEIVPHLTTGAQTDLFGKLLEANLMGIDAKELLHEYVQQNPEAIDQSTLGNEQRGVPGNAGVIEGQRNEAGERPKFAKHQTPKQRADAEQRFYEEERKEKSKAKEFGHKETAKYSESLQESAQNARETVQAIDEGLKALESRGGPGFNDVAYKYLKDKGNPLADIFQSKDAAKINLSAKVLAGGFKQLFGSKPTQAEFFWYETILPGLLKSKETNKAIYGYFRKVAESAIQMSDIHDEIVKENKGYRPIDIDRQIRSRMGGQFENLIKEGQQLYETSGKGKTGKTQEKKGTVKLLDPQGRELQVPESEVDRLIKAGAKRP